MGHRVLCGVGRTKIHLSSSQTHLLFLLLLFVILIPMCSSVRYAEYVKSPTYVSDALQTLRNVKKLLASDRTFVAKRKSRRHRSCRGVYDHCVAWNARRDQKCCDASDVCTCNILFQNCRCEPRGFNWRSWW